VATYQAFKTGQLEAAILTDPKALAQAKGDKVPSFEYLQNVAAEILLNNRKGSALADVRVRQAIGMAFDIGIYNQRVYDGLGPTTNQLFPPGSRWNDQSMPPGITHDVAKAKELVAAVKQDTGWDGSVRFIGNNTPDAQPISVALESMLTPIGIKLNAQTNLTPDQVIQQVIVKRDFDMAAFGANISDADPFPHLYLTFYPTSPNNFSGYSNPDMTAALDELQVTADPQKEKAILDRIATIWNQTVPFINIGSIPNVIINKPNVHDLDYELDDLVGFQKAWLS
jgi:peptide/nickel transport system substrate-binding protein